MGCVTSCFHVADDEAQGAVSPPAFRHCSCLRCLTEHFYTALFQRGQVHVISPSSQGRTPLGSGSVGEVSSIPDTYHSPPRPLPYDDPRCSISHCQHGRQVSRGDKASSHSHKESESIRTGNIGTEYAGTDNKQSGSHHGGESNLCLTKSSMKLSGNEFTSNVSYIYYSSSDDEDVCSTCLEEYTSENPRITLQCSHYFHLSCIYEWMERSEACPICGKVMLFNETK